MAQIVVNAEMRAKLLDLGNPVEFVDEEGNLLGRFVPSLDPELHNGEVPDISPEEIERRYQARGKTYTTAEVLARLEKL